MKNALRHNDKKFVLIGKINGLASQARRARDLILKAKDQKAVSSLSYRKHVVGIDIRHHLLAYAFLRGLPYKNVERNCAEDNRPRADWVWTIVETHAPKWIPYDIISKTGGGSYDATLNEVHVWLAGGC